MEAAIRWSPHHSDHEARYLVLDIVSSSLTLHQVSEIKKSHVASSEIGSFSKLPNFAAFDWSKTEADIISLGHVSGSASIIKLNAGSQTSEIRATYKARQQRRCNSTALSVQDWLAVALDKTRSDLCLNIYDVRSDKTSEPVQRLCPAEFISSVRFFSGQPREILVGAQRQYIRLYDLRDGFAGNPGSLHVATKCVNNISIDPLDENYFAAGGSSDDPSVTIWDKRYLASNISATDTAPVFEFRPAIDGPRSSVWALRYSGKSRGRLALSSSTGELKIIDMVENKTIDFDKLIYRPPNPHGGVAWSSKSYVQQTRVLENTSAVPPTSTRSNRILAFDWTAETGRNQNIIVLRADRSADAFSVYERPAYNLSSSNTLSLATVDMRVLRTADEMQATHSRQSSLNTTETHVDDTMDGIGKLVINADDISSDNFPVSDIARSRAKAGYLFDCRRNITITADSYQLRRLWDTIERLRALAAHDGMVYETYNFSFVGISGIWNGQPIEVSTDRDASNQIKPMEAMAGLVEKRQIPMFEGARTVYDNHRQLCLAVCGWKFSPEDLEAECQALIEQQLHYQAIVQAVLHDRRHLALNLLRSLIRSKAIQNSGLGALLAADQLNDHQREMTQWMAADTDDPALKALLAYLHSGDWRDVMKTNYLHLGYRLALGLKYLNDTELNGFIQSETARAIKNGDLEGVLLTGLTGEAMDLFQTYITRTNDLQTAVLATAYTNPRFVEDARWQMWKETYFLQMQAWQAFSERTRFTVEHNRLSKIKHGQTAATASETAARLRCVHCHGDISRPPQLDKRQISQRPTAASIAVNMGTVCPTCHRPLPRCGVCTLWLGAPDPRKARSLVSTKQNSKADAMEKMLVFCTKCDHGSHGHHAREWFDQYAVCPVPGCACQCSDKPMGQGFSMLDLWQTNR